MTDLEQQATATTSTDASASATTATSTGTSGVTPTEKTFTQADLDRIISERLARHEATANKRLLEDLGVKDVAELRTRLTAPQPSGTEADAKVKDLSAQMEALRAEKAAAEEKLQAIQAERTREKRDVHITEALSKARSTDPKRVLILLNAEQPQLLEKVLKEDGTADTAALEALVKAAQEAFKPLFTGGGPGSPSNAGGRTVSPGADQKRVATVNQKELIRRNF